jgi:hypothetical protein
MSYLTEFLIKVLGNDLDSKIRSEVKSLTTNELGDSEFLMNIIIWFEILSAINLVGEFLQSKDMLIDDVVEIIKGLWLLMHWIIIGKLVLIMHWFLKGL